jgi:Pentapeptide repeats (8 copies)
MANLQQLTILNQGITAWNTWRELYPEIWPDLDGINLSDSNLAGINFSKTTFQKSVLQHTNLEGANLNEAIFIGADLSGANLKGANLSKASLTDTILRATDFSGANLNRANLYGAILIYTNMTNSILTDCLVWGASVWHVQLEGAKQTDLIITPPYEPTITVDNLKIAQFIYLLLNNEEIRDVINTITSKVVLILGRFTSERKAVLDALRDALRLQGYLPILFDFEKPASRDITETISTLAHLARFVIADITDAKSIPQELMTIVPHLPSVPVQPLILNSQHEYGMFEHFARYPWVLPIYRYTNEGSLLQSLKEKVIEPAEQKAKEISSPESH